MSFEWAGAYPSFNKKSDNPVSCVLIDFSEISCHSAPTPDPRGDSLEPVNQL
jgi:hypothetical protein